MDFVDLDGMGTHRRWKRYQKKKKIQPDDQVECGHDSDGDDGGGDGDGDDDGGGGGDGDGDDKI